MLDAAGRNAAGEICQVFIRFVHASKQYDKYIRSLHIGRI